MQLFAVPLDPPLDGIINNSFCFSLDSPCTRQAADKGPCFSALQHEVQMEAAEGSKLKSSSCKRYLEELLNKCSWRNTTYTATDCHSFCSKFDL